jgi:hypothetical protein
VGIKLNPGTLSTVTLATPWPTEEPYILPQETTLAARKSKTYLLVSTLQPWLKSTTTRTLRTTTRTTATQLAANATIAKAALSSPTTLQQSPTSVALRKPSPTASKFFDEERFDDARYDVLFCEDPLSGSEPSLVGRRAAHVRVDRRSETTGTIHDRNNATCTTRATRSVGTGTVHHRPAGKTRARPTEVREEGGAANLVATGTGALAAAAAFLVLLL